MYSVSSISWLLLSIMDHASGTIQACTFPAKQNNEYHCLLNEQGQVLGLDSDGRWATFESSPTSKLSFNITRSELSSTKEQSTIFLAYGNPSTLTLASFNHTRVGAFHEQGNDDLDVDGATFSLFKTDTIPDGQCFIGLHPFALNYIQENKKTDIDQLMSDLLYSNKGDIYMSGPSQHPDSVKSMLWRITKSKSSCKEDITTAKPSITQTQPTTKDTKEQNERCLNRKRMQSTLDT